jgi:hypothetical protein
MVQLAVPGSGAFMQLPAMQGRICCVLNMCVVSDDVRRWMAVVAVGFAGCTCRRSLCSFHPQVRWTLLSLVSTVYQECLSTCGESVVGSTVAHSRAQFACSLLADSARRSIPVQLALNPTCAHIGTSGQMCAFETWLEGAWCCLHGSCRRLVVCTLSSEQLGCARFVYGGCLQCTCQCNRRQIG